MSAAVLVPPLVVVLLLGEPWIALLVLAIVAGAAWETFRLVQAAGSPVLAILGTVLAVVVAGSIGLASLPNPIAVGAPALAAVAIVLLAAGALARHDPRDGLAAWMATTFGVLYASLLGFVPALGALAPEPAVGSPLAAFGADRSWILVLVLAVWCYDSGAYLVGSRVGGRRFLTHISPSKTYAGLVGGLVAAALVTTALVVWLGRPPVAGLALGLLVGLAAQAGDLAESMLKRGAGVKDSGTLIPGHGGLLDRVDSFLFAAPVTALYVLALFR
ncbi:MAG TPA: phosphatidate cytidylyltransferase [Candidatus Limnocylindrales bacterium]|nr:phosphatidate cytidylyltransferase [Candidatus Limnocylindrales bacterium]